MLSARLGSDARDLVRDLVAAAGAVVVDFGAAHREAAMSAWWRFGKSRHPAALDFGDRIAYATAQIAGEPLLAKGHDFSETDIALA